MVGWLVHCCFSVTNHIYFDCIREKGNVFGSLLVGLWLRSNAIDWAPKLVKEFFFSFDTYTYTYIVHTTHIYVCNIVFIRRWTESLRKTLSIIISMVLLLYYTVVLVSVFPPKSIPFFVYIFWSVKFSWVQFNYCIFCFAILCAIQRVSIIVSSRIFLT